MHAAWQTDTDLLWRRDGTPLAVEFTANPMIEEERITGVVIAFCDVSAHQRTEASLRETQERLRHLERLAADASDRGRAA